MYLKILNLLFLLINCIRGKRIINLNLNKYFHEIKYYIYCIFKFFYKMLKKMFCKKYDKNIKKTICLKTTKKTSIMAPIEFKKKQNQNQEIIFTSKKTNFLNYKNLGLNLFKSNSNFQRFNRNEKYNSYLNSKSSIRTQTNSSNLYLTTNTTFNIDKSKIKIHTSKSESKNYLLKKKMNLQNEIIKLKTQKYNLLKEQKDLIENKNKLNSISDDLKKINLIINNYKKDYNELNIQCSNLKNNLNLIQKENK